MRVCLQRVRQARVTVDDQVVGQISHGWLALVGLQHNDTESIVDRMAEKVATLRVFNDQQGKFNRSVLDVGGGVLVVSQFTLYADARKGRRPSFTEAARPELAQPLVQRFAAQLQAQGVGCVEQGQFGAMMMVSLDNDGPVTIWLDSAEVL